MELTRCYRIQNPLLGQRLICNLVELLMHRCSLRILELDPIVESFELSEDTWKTKENQNDTK